MMKINNWLDISFAKATLFNDTVKVFIALQRQLLNRSHSSFKKCVNQNIYLDGLLPILVYPS